MELLDEVDNNGQPTGRTVTRSKAHLEGIMHRTSHVWLVRKKNGGIEVLLQKRCDKKESFPGCYDISSAGHIPAGDDFVQSAIRELKEELGIEAKDDDLILCGNRIVEWDDEFGGAPFHDRQYSRVFAMWCELDESEFSLQEEEVSEVIWMDFDKALKSVNENLIPHCIYLKELQMVMNTISE